MSSAMTKVEARKLFLQKRKELSDAQRDVFNLHIYNHFFLDPALSFVHTLHIFLSMERTREPDTWQLIDRIRREMPHIRLVIPRISNDGLLDHIYFEGLHQLKLNDLGIMEPQQGVPAEVSKIDMVLVPLVAVDRDGNRVGYGKGFYDRFLADCRPNCTKIGLSFFEPVDEITDAEAHDVPLDVLITPAGRISFVR
jgi:5-formyltetrahydrofolate cyclo-ligase